ncbi:YopX family protein [Brevibacillus sp. FSL L8-0710]|uniref:YopX family protein n=1 Tax=Brevibacillus sp. FSL L8-0710 TaxID=2975313 RepID=UPI0030F81A9F
MQAGREVKYRAFVHSVKWVVDVVAIDFSIKEVELDMSGTGDTAYYRFDEVDLLQFTGLRDKNGKEIYEKDIVWVEHALVSNVPSYQAVIEWDKYRFALTKPNEINYQVGPFPYNNLDPFGLNLEVLGNIYKNPELLEVGK